MRVRRHIRSDRKLAMIDYAMWINDAKQFASSLQKRGKQIRVKASVRRPISSRVMDQIEDQMVHGLPRALRALYTEGAGSCEIRYLWSPTGDDLVRLEAVYDGPDDNYLV